MGWHVVLILEADKYQWKEQLEPINLEEVYLGMSENLLVQCKYSLDVIVSWLTWYLVLFFWMEIDINLKEQAELIILDQVF